jgi:hypothetical protein
MSYAYRSRKRQKPQPDQEDRTPAKGIMQRLRDEKNTKMMKKRQHLIQRMIAKAIKQSGRDQQLGNK